MPDRPDGGCAELPGDLSKRCRLAWWDLTQCLPDRFLERGPAHVEIDIQIAGGAFDAIYDSLQELHYCRLVVRQHGLWETAVELVHQGNRLIANQNCHHATSSSGHKD
jgi:hypothetical protein